MRSYEEIKAELEKNIERLESAIKIMDDLRINDKAILKDALKTITEDFPLTTETIALMLAAKIKRKEAKGENRPDSPNNNYEPFLLYTKEDLEFFSKLVKYKQQSGQPCNYSFIVKGVYIEGRDVNDMGVHCTPFQLTSDEQKTYLTTVDAMGDPKNFPNVRRLLGDKVEMDTENPESGTQRFSQSCAVHSMHDLSAFRKVTEHKGKKRLTGEEIKNHPVFFRNTERPETLKEDFKAQQANKSGSKKGPKTLDDYLKQFSVLVEFTDNTGQTRITNANQAIFYRRLKLLESALKFLEEVHGKDPQNGVARIIAERTGSKILGEPYEALYHRIRTASPDAGIEHFGETIVDSEVVGNALHWAARTGQTNLVEGIIGNNLLKHKISEKHRDFALEAAAFYGHSDSAKKLLVIVEKPTPFTIKAILEKGDEEIIRLLLDGHINLNEEVFDVYYRRTPLEHTVYHNIDKAAVVIIDQVGEQIDPVYLSNALDCACKRKDINPELIEKFLGEKTVNKLSEENIGQALIKLNNAGRKDIIDRFMGSLPNEKVVKILRQMVSLDPKNLTDVLLKNESLKQKINPNEYKELSVEAAILSNDSKLTNDLLLEQEIDPQIMEKFFIKAVQHSDVSTVKVLLDHGANPNTIFDTKFQTNALHEVIVQGREEIFLPLLLDRDVDPNGVDNDMFTPLYYAVSKNKEKAVEVILEKAGDIMRPEHIESAFNDTFSSWNFNSKLIERFLDKKIIGKLSGKVLGQCLKEALERKDEGVIEKFTSSEFLAVASKEQLEAIIDHVKNETSHSNIVEILEKAKTPDSPESSTKTTSRTITEIFDKTETTRIGSLSSSSPSKKGKQESSLNCVKSGNFSL